MKAATGDFCLSIIVLYLVIVSGLTCNAEVDTIARSIWLENNVVLVKDELRFSREIAEAQGRLWDVFSDLQKNGSGTTNLFRNVGTLLEGEDLSPKSIYAFYSNGVVNLRIISEVSFKQTNNVAKLHLVACLGEVSINEREWLQHPDKIGHTEHLGGRIKDEMFICRSSDSFTLYFPDFGPAEEDLRNFNAFKDMFSFYTKQILFGLKNQQNYACRLNTGPGVVLLDWVCGDVSDSPSLTDLKALNQLHPMSENDLISLVTSMKLAKGGFYKISSN